FTTVSHCKQANNDIEWEGKTYTWSKHTEFLRLSDLPRRTAQPLELALAADDAESLALLRSKGWRVIDAAPISRDILPYRDYIRAARGEFTVAKEQNIRFRTGWFSDRSACFLAAGKPVVTQDTAFGEVLPLGEGLFAFGGMEEALAAIEAINADYPRHCRAARAVAEEHFRAERVLASLLERAGL
ncbi:MAG: hypothetical protein AABZ64_08285, partial [Nitrospinota bacterium]